MSKKKTSKKKSAKKAAKKTSKKAPAKKAKRKKKAKPVKGSGPETWARFFQDGGDLVGELVFTGQECAATEKGLAALPTTRPDKPAARDLVYDPSRGVVLKYAVYAGAVAAKEYPVRK